MKWWLKVMVIDLWFGKLIAWGWLAWWKLEYDLVITGGLVMKRIVNVIVEEDKGRGSKKDVKY